MSDLFRKEALSRRSRALFGEIILRSPLSNWAVLLLVLAVIGLIIFILFGIEIRDGTIFDWITS